MLGVVGLVTLLLAGALLVWSRAEFAGPATTVDRVEASAAAGQPTAAARASARRVGANATARRDWIVPKGGGR